mmetsp:Transcript_128507/g.240440  ORF Transcript_128507/g.240440 Transcript_128507/m.240440 type:complete len:527 (+) Transcript_128507:100-1680(+)
MVSLLTLAVAAHTALRAAANSNSKTGQAEILPWAPPPADSPDLIAHLRDTSRPKLAYSTYIAWYEDGGMNESALLHEAEFMANRLRQHGWTLVLHDYGWQVCGTTYNITPISTPTKLGCYHLDQYGRLLPAPQRYPSTAKDGSWKPIADKMHAVGMGFGLHLIHGVPIIAAQKKLPVLGTNFTLDQLVAQKCPSFIADHWIINASHPAAQAYYDSMVSMWADAGIDFIYFDGVEGSDCGCQAGAVSLLSSAMKRLGKGMFMYTSFGPPSAASGCSFEELSELAAYVRVGGDTQDFWDDAMQLGFSGYTRTVAPLLKPHHFGDLASTMIGKVHCRLGTPGCGTGPDYFIPSNRSALTKDEVISDVALNAIFRSTWWHAGAFSYSNDWDLSMMTNDDVIRITMMSTNTRQVPTSITTPASWDGPGVVWTGDDTVEDWKYVLMVNMCPCTSTALKCWPCPADPATEVSVDVDFLALGLTPSTSCEVTELWGSKSMGRVYGKLHASLRSHASLLVKLSNCTGPTSDIIAV